MLEKLLGFRTISCVVLTPEGEVRAHAERMEGCSKKKTCAPSQTGCATTTILTWHPALKLWKKMLAFYTEKGMDILKGTVSIPGVSLNYLGAVERVAELHRSEKEAYYMLKGAVVGVDSLVFTRYHEVSVTKIRSHHMDNPRFCQSLLSVDHAQRNALREGKSRSPHRRADGRAAPVLKQRLKDGTWFGFDEVDIKIPEPLFPKLEEMCPFFYNKELPVEAVPQKMLDYLKRTGRTCGERKKC